jgi:insertion element IS1 protein InsB
VNEKALARKNLAETIVEIVPEIRQVSKYKMQKIERKHLTLRTRIKRLARKTICFSKSEEMHDLVIGLFINRYEFGLDI